MPTLTLTDLSTHCLSAIEVALAGHEVAVIDAEGRPRFVVMGVQRYRELLADEAVAALAQGGGLIWRPGAAWPSPRPPMWRGWRGCCRARHRTVRFEDQP